MCRFVATDEVEGEERDMITYHAESETDKILPIAPPSDHHEYVHQNGTQLDATAYSLYPGSDQRVDSAPLSTHRWQRSGYGKVTYAASSLG